jgi:hypothetical protein
MLQGGSAEHGTWIRENIRQALRARRMDPGAVAALTGLAPGTVRGFLNGRPSSIDNVLLIAESVGYPLAKLDQPPELFRRTMDYRRDVHEDGVDASMRGLGGPVIPTGADLGAGATDASHVAPSSSRAEP